MTAPHDVPESTSPAPAPFTPEQEARIRQFALLAVADAQRRSPFAVGAMGPELISLARCEGEAPSLIVTRREVEGYPSPMAEFDLAIERAARPRQHSTDPEGHAA